MSKFEIILTIINVLAIIASPIAAVFLGHNVQDRSQKRRDKLEIFRALMMNRGIGWSVESVHALNLIDVVFSDDNTVRMRWKEYYTQLCIQSPNEMQRKQVQEAQDKLLEAMACSLGYKEQVTWETIQNPYTPKGMWDAMQQQQNIQNGQEKWAGAVDLLTKVFCSGNAQPMSAPVVQKEDTHADPGMDWKEQGDQSPSGRAVSGVGAQVQL